MGFTVRLRRLLLYQCDPSTTRPVDGLTHRPIGLVQPGTHLLDFANLLFKRFEPNLHYRANLNRNSKVLDFVKSSGG